MRLNVAFQTGCTVLVPTLLDWYHNSALLTCGQAMAAGYCPTQRCKPVDARSTEHDPHRETSSLASLQALLMHCTGRRELGLALHQQADVALRRCCTWSWTQHTDVCPASVHYICTGCLCVDGELMYDGIGPARCSVCDSSHRVRTQAYGVVMQTHKTERCTHTHARCVRGCRRTTDIHCLIGGLVHACADHFDELRWISSQPRSRWQCIARVLSFHASMRRM
jgi:hypothetical protein